MDIQDHTGKVLDKWTVASREEEQIILQQFLRFGETKSITQQILLQESNEKPDYIVQTPRTESDIRKFIERSNRVANPFLRHQPLLDSQSLLNNRQTYSHNNRLLRLPPIPASSQSMSPNGSVHNFGSPVHTSSPISMSPLNRLQNMQPYDFRKDGPSPVSPQTSPITGGQQQTLLNSPATMPLALTTTPMTSEVGLSSLASSNSDVPRPDSTEYMEDQNSESGAINLSRPSQSMYATKKVKHLRKSANPMKRRWSPISLGTLTTSPCTGKKRVQCNVCLKTFCDKGALKIHFSAVHLKEMHKCTVEGCNMMFSSRRSRNRHSANPNPKLHTPHFRRKSYGEARNTTSISSLQPHMLSGGTLLQTEKIHSLGDLVNNNNNSLLTNNNNIDSSNSEGIQEDQPFYVNANNEVGLLPHLSHKQELDDSENSEADSLTPSVKEEQNLNKGVRKRKNMNPTRLAVTDEEIYVSSDEASNDNFSHDDNNMDITENNDDNHIKNDANILVRNHSDLKSELKSNEDEPLSLLPAYKIKNEKIDNETKDIILSCNTFRQIQENAMRHMETFSHARLGDMISSSLLSNNRVIIENQLPVQNGPSSYSLSQNSEIYDHNSNHNSKNQAVSPLSLQQDSPSSGGYLNNSEHDHESNMSHSSAESQSPANLFRDVNSVSCFDIPVDKENPRKCTACGKIFQNHFGVKTHYQNVHLKLMHKCTVEGCNAAFPSKRSRDRHSANLNLHRKLLSTTSDKFALDRNNVGQSLRDEFLARIYESHNMTVSEYHSQQMQVAQDLSSNKNGQSENLANNHDQNNSIQSLSFHNSNSDFGGNADSQTAPPSPSNHSYSSSTHDCNYDSANEDSPCSDQEVSVHCHICKLKFRDNLVLKEHFEKMHPKETFSCTVDGCDKIFSTRKSRNRHSQNDNLHKHLVNSGS